MKRHQQIISILLAGVMSAGMLTGCSSITDLLEGGSTESSAEGQSVVGFQPIPEEYTIEAMAAREQAEKEAAEAAEEAARLAEEEANRAKMPDGCYASELTGLPVSTSIQSQRPVAIMVDNDERALPHYNLSNCDIMFEMMNSTDNKRITRLMAVYKDWQNLDTTGSIRSVRPTNIMVAGELNAFIAHDGGPVYVDSYFNKGYTPHLSGYFTRISNGKATEFTEYVGSGSELASRLSSAGISSSYTNYQGAYFNFVEYGQDELTLDGEDGAIVANSVAIPFEHTASGLVYNSSTGTYDYKEYGEISIDAGNSQPVTFKNAIVYSCSHYVYDEHGYMVYNLVTDGSKGMPGYYFTNGMAIPITWSKSSESGQTKFYKKDGTEITLNCGSTYVCIVPSDSWSSLTIQ